MTEEKLIEDLQKQIDELRKMINVLGGKNIFYKKSVVISAFLMSFIAIVLGFIALLS